MFRLRRPKRKIRRRANRAGSGLRSASRGAMVLLIVRRRVKMVLRRAEVSRVAPALVPVVVDPAIPEALETQAVLDLVAPVVLGLAGRVVVDLGVVDQVEEALVSGLVLAVSAPVLDQVDKGIFFRKTPRWPR